MLEFGMQTVGYAAAMGYLANFPHAVDSGGYKALKEIAPFVVEKAKQNLADYPAYITGDLYRSVYWQDTGEKIVIGARMYYAYFVEYGTSKMEAEPYLRPAIVEFLESSDGRNQIMSTIKKEAAKGAAVGAAVGEFSTFAGLLTTFLAISSIALTGMTMAMGAMR